MRKDRQDEERSIENNPPNPASSVLIIDEHILKVWEEGTDKDPPAL